LISYLQLRESAQKLPKRNVTLESGKWSPNAEMGAHSESNVAIRFAIHLYSARLVELARVAVCRSEEEHQRFAARDGLSSYFQVL